MPFPVHKDKTNISNINSKKLNNNINKLILKTMIRVLLVTIGLFGTIFCTFSQDIKQNDTTRFYVVEKDSISYVFVENSYAYSVKDSAILLCEKAIKKGLDIIGENEFSTKYYIQLVNSEDEMEKYIGGCRTCGGMNRPEIKTVYISFTADEIGPLTHELMHMVVICAWGWPPKNCYWLNEGLATYAANYCSGYTVEELYAFFISQNMLFSMDSLTSGFYKNKDMIAYHQSAFVVQYLIENYGIEKLKDLWQAGFQDINKIYGFSYNKLEKDIQEFLQNKYPISPSIDWDIVGKGCELINLKEKKK
jgi:hypothetical protein